jgi:hypothetical protein
MVLVIVCHYLINKDDDRITFGQIEDVFRCKSSFNEAKAALKEVRVFFQSPRRAPAKSATCIPVMKKQSLL